LIVTDSSASGCSRERNHRLGGAAGRAPGRALEALEGDVVSVGRAVGRLGGRRGRWLVAAGLGAVLERDVVELVGDALAAVAGRVQARLEAPRERDRLALDQVLGGGLGLAAPDDQVDVDRVRFGGCGGRWRPRRW
jgi:hypothetical protein